jgi:hypothetical protein
MWGRSKVMQIYDNRRNSNASFLVNLRAMARWLTLVISFLLSCPVLAQVHVVSPLTRGIIQVRGNEALLHLRASVPVGYQHFAIKLSSDIDTTDPFSGMTRIDPASGWIDTILRVPKSLRNYALCWSADSNGVPIQGTIAGLTPGHIIGIAGQSNAVGASWQLVAQAEGDIRMLHSDIAWEPAQEPTGNLAAGPWIVMANELYKFIGDTLPIGIVNTAVGATGLTMFNPWGGQWIRNPLGTEDTGIYGRSIHRLREAGAIIDALFWIQGESDCSTVTNPEVYRTAFERLMSGFHTDLRDTFPIFHSQISSYEGITAGGYPAVRESERDLPSSILVGTAVGLPLQGDHLHYTAETYRTVGRMFADAFLAEKYHLSGGHLYPPLIPDSAATLDSISHAASGHRYCFLLRFTRGGSPADLRIVTASQYFVLHRDTMAYDTSEVWYQIAPNDFSKIQIGLKSESIDLNYKWYVSYDAFGASDQAPVATFDTITRDTIFATAFFRIPVQMPNKRASVHDSPKLAGIISTGDAIECPIFVEQNDEVTVTLRDVLGAERLRSSCMIAAGHTVLDIPVHDLVAGCYWVTLQYGNRTRDVTKVLIIR